MGGLLWRSPLISPSGGRGRVAPRGLVVSSPEWVVIRVGGQPSQLDLRRGRVAPGKRRTWGDTHPIAVGGSASISSSFTAGSPPQQCRGRICTLAGSARGATSRHDGGELDYAQVRGGRVRRQGEAPLAQLPVGSEELGSDDRVVALGGWTVGWQYLGGGEDPGAQIWHGIRGGGDTPPARISAGSQGVESWASGGCWVVALGGGVGSRGVGWRCLGVGEADSAEVLHGVYCKGGAPLV